jgi:hypothetical protein
MMLQFALVAHRNHRKSALFKASTARSSPNRASASPGSDLRVLTCRGKNAPKLPILSCGYRK